MRSYTQNKPLGTDGATDAAVRNLQKQTELQFYDSTTIKVEQTLRGVRFHAKIQRTPAAVGMIFMGEYNPATYYSVGNCVVIRSGASAGFYVCIQANAGNAPQMPDTGNGYWINLNGNAPTMGQWL